MKINATLGLLIMLAVMLIPNQAEAIGEKAVSGGLELSIPTGNFGDVAGTGFGVTGQFLYKFKDNIIFTGTTGYIIWGGKDFGTSSYNYSEIPLKAGAKYYFHTNIYGMAELGLHIYSYKFEYTDPWSGNKVSSSDSNTEIGFAPGVGYEMPIKDKMSFDVSIRYEIGDLDCLGVRAGINYDI
ncbi:outer membrane beta-barrel protein [bacterium]|nr:outer membrane beta-barrel protein [bacterium]